MICSTDKIFSKARLHKNKDLPFVLYREPKSEVLNGVFQQHDELVVGNELSQFGFVFAPFDDSENTVIMPMKISDSLQSDLEDLKNCNTKKSVKGLREEQYDFDWYRSLLSKTIQLLKQEYFKKVVVSRQENMAIDQFNFLDVYQNMLCLYPNAFVYAWYHPKVGFWMGASPELLLECEGQEFETMSLAGTQKIKDDSKIIWQSKELEEQNIVTSYILNNLKNFELQVSDAETKIAGNIAHICTKLRGVLESNQSLLELVEKLHPTPAVCGMPLHKSKQYIIENEGYDRSFYTGYLGLIHQKNNKSKLYVNLRCMQVFENRLQIYVGGGLTAQSDVEKELEETIVKSKIMKSVL